ncbi:MAG: hypothetical protein ACOCVR_00195, partial [Myxococcota bacterium]
SGHSGGPIDASKHGSTADGPCVGMIDDSPDHTVVLTSSFSYLRIQAISDEDVSLVIKGPDRMRCNDDSNGLNPKIDGSWPAGTYQVYVGSVASGNHPYTLAISELQPSGGSGQASAEGGDYQPVTLSPGFVPDPRTLTGASGGPVDAGNMGGECVGMIDNTADHVMTLTDDFSFLKLSVESDGDTTLVVKGPGGNRCNDDTNGLNPVLQGSWPAGRYEIYVGSMGGGNHRYTISVTEIP